MIKKTSLCIFFFYTIASLIYAQSEKLSVKDLISISNMTRMNDATGLLTSHGYTRVEPRFLFYSPKVASFWRKDCELKINEGGSFITVDVEKVSASAMSILANGREDVVSIFFYDEEERNNCLTQMKSLGFKRIQRNESAGNTSEYYANDTDTIKVHGRREEKTKYLIINSSGRSDSISLKNDELESYIIKASSELEILGYKLTPIDQHGYVFTQGENFIKIIRANDIWDGSVFELSICRKRDWSEGGEIEILYPADPVQ